MTTTCFMIAYWGDDEDVAFVSMDDDSRHYEGSFSSIMNAYQRLICDGHITEILEVIHTDTLNSTYEFASDRCDYWRETLREQGYAVSSKEGEE